MWDVGSVCVECGVWEKCGQAGGVPLTRVWGKRESRGDDQN